MGGDFAPDAALEGAVLSLNEISDDVQVALVGKKSIIEDYLISKGIVTDKFVIVDAPQVIEMAEHPTTALSQKPDSSIAIGFGMLAKGKAAAFCSAGNTGAMMVGAMFSVKAIPGVSRPAIAGFLPKTNGSYGVLIDAGANAECKPEHLAQFGELGSIYAEEVFKIKTPRVGLVNLGEEEGKGTSILKAAHQLLKNNPKIHFIGNLEGRDLFLDKADVVVCDGYVGNVILKLSESFYDILGPKAEAEGKKVDEFISYFNYEFYGGSPIIGVNGVVIIGHGVSTPIAIKNMILQSVTIAKTNITEHIKENFRAYIPSPTNE